jgi:hypothetical protein
VRGMEGGRVGWKARRDEEIYTCKYIEREWKREGKKRRKEVCRMKNRL